MKINELETMIKKELHDKLYHFLFNHGYEIDYNSSCDAVLLAFKDYKEKRLPTIKYKVYFSSALKRRFGYLTEMQKQNVMLFKYNFENGIDMNSHLSKNIFKQTDDKLLNFWGIKHLHLNERVASSKKDFKNNRSAIYLLICCHKDEIIFLDVVPHLASEGFANIDFLNLLYEENWLEKAGFIYLDDAKSVLPEITSASDIYKMWNYHINISGFILRERYICLETENH